MSDETHDASSETGSDGASAPDAAATPARPRPAAPGAAAARRARQLGGPRRPLPQPRPTPPDDAGATGPAPATTPAATPSRPTTPAVGVTTPAAPKSSVGRAAARPRPRPRPTAEPAATSTPETAPETAPETTGSRGAGRLFVGVSLVLTVVLLAVGAVFLVRTVTAKPGLSQQETERVLSSAKTDVALFASYGYQTIDADAAKASAVLTGQFKQDYLKSIAEVVKPQLPTSKTVNAGQVDTAGLVSVSSDGEQAVVVVYGQNSITNTAQTTPRIDAFQLQVTMQRVGGQWLVAQLKQLGNNA